MEITDLDLALRKRFKNIWRCADSNKWDLLKDTNLLSFDWINKDEDYKGKTKKEIGRGQKAIHAFVNYLKKGDLIFVMGKNSFQGIAVCESEYEFKGLSVDMGPSGEKPAVKVNYLFKLDQSVNHGISTHNNPTTFARIDQYNFGLKNVLSFLKKDIPEAYEVLRNNCKSSTDILSNSTNKTLKTPLNQILYGPPGTGKTHFLLEKIVPKYSYEATTKSDESIEAELISNLPWWKVFALILLEGENLSVPQIKEHKYTKYKLEVSNTKSLNQTVWGQLSSHTVNDSETVEYSSRSKVLIFDKKGDSTWFISKKKSPVIDELNELKKELDDHKNNKSKRKGNYKFITFHQSTSYETFVEGITPIFDENSGDDNGEVKYEIKKGAFYQACEEASKLAGFIGLKDCLEASKEERIKKFKTAPSFGLFIDEINRGNVSSILGELITLIEEDKRLSRNEIILELPYSQRKFGVPPNLYITGTMNTADRSVEALDTALRRRFSFMEMLPKYNIDEDKATLMYSYAGFKGAEILETINLRIEQLLDRDHLIGHSYFLLDKDQSKEVESRLLDSFYRNIIPLLQEYFYGDYAKIGAVLGSGFVIKNENDAVTFGDGFNDEDYGDKDIYQIIDYSIKENPLIPESMSFEEAIRKLMNKPKENKAETEG